MFVMLVIISIYATVKVPEVWFTQCFVILALYQKGTNR